MNDPEEVMDDYETMLDSLVKQWVLLEIKHRTSKSGSEEFWDLAKSFFPKLQSARIAEMVYKPIPKLRSQRKKIYRDEVPDVHLELGFVNKDTNELNVINVDHTPTNQFDRKTFEKVFEVGTVQV